MFGLIHLTRRQRLDATTALKWQADECVKAAWLCWSPDTRKAWLNEARRYTEARAKVQYGLLWRLRHRGHDDTQDLVVASLAAKMGVKSSYDIP